jgi:hypothetical protein
MVYLIDGHNLIGQLPDLKLDDPDDEAKLVQKLIGFTARTKKRVVVIFDHGLPGGRSRMSTGMVEVIFASRPSEADALMIGRIKAAPDPGQWTVVSSDQTVLEAARARKMRIIRSRDFASELNRPAPAPRRTAHKDGGAHDVHVSAAEVEEWLRIFGADETTPPRKRRDK